MAANRRAVRQWSNRPRLARLARRTDVIGGVGVFSFAAGTTPPTSADIVLVHGLAVSNRYWRPVMRRLGTEYHVLAPDLPGVGRSTDPRHQLTVSDVVDGLVAWMDVVGVEKPVLVGHSLGCELVAILAARHPERVAALVLVSPGGHTVHRPLWQQAIRLLADGLRERPSMVFIAATDYVRVGTRTMLRTIGEARR
jgi:pimeloyl-ACP methyl ester carboxylesterase